MSVDSELIKGVKAGGRTWYEILETIRAWCKVKTNRMLEKGLQDKERHSVALSVK